MKYLNYILMAVICFAWQIRIDGQELYQVSPLNINTHEYVEESPVYYKDGLVFISNRSQSALRKDIDQDGQPLTDLFFSKQKENKKFTAPDLFSKELKTRMHEGPASFDSTGKTIYFSKIEDEFFEICTATFNGSDWVNIKALPFNQKNYHFTHPCLSHDGKKLFFASNRPGGQGGFDIWVSNSGRSGWGPPKNMGPIVNSDTTDYYPFFHRNGKLYFASCRKGGIGHADIYWTMEINGQWLPPKPLPPPINTRYEDYTYISDSTDRRGYISSTRNRSSDIYSFINTMPVAETPKPIEVNSYQYRITEESIITDSSTFTYEWDFGDGTKSKGRELDVIHDFPKPGDYEVALNVIDSLTGEVMLRQSTKLIEVRDEIQPVITCNDTVYNNEEVVFDSKESYLPDFKSPEFFWDFGDGTEQKGSKVSHSFCYPGIYRVILSAGDKQKDQNLSGIMSVYKTITVLKRK